MRISDWSSDVCSSDLIERQVEDDTLSVRADQERVLEVLANIIDNAIRHSPEGGTVVLRATEHEDGVRIDVCDGGPVPTNPSTTTGRYGRDRKSTRLNSSQ